MTIKVVLKRNVYCENEFVCITYIFFRVGIRVQVCIEYRADTRVQ